MTTRLKEKYNKEIISPLQSDFNIANKFDLPKIEKIIVSSGLGKATIDAKILDTAKEVLRAITGQEPSQRKAKKSIAGFKLREGMPIGYMVTLRGNRMYEFLDRLINVAIPRIRDFRGFNYRSFDSQGNFNLGISEHQIFPETTEKAFPHQIGLQVTIVIKNKHIDQAKKLLELFGFPFKK